MKNFSLNGRRLLLFSSLLFSSLLLKAQVTGTSQFHIEVCRVMSGNPAIPDPNCLEPGCFRYYYEIYLVPNNTSIPNIFQADALDISAQLTVNGTVLATNPIPDLISRFNVNSTHGCFNNAGLNAYVTPNGEEISYSAIHHIGQSYVNIFFQIGQRVRLFTAVVDAFPGETIDVIGNAVYSYTPQGSATSLIPMDVHHYCGQISPVYTEVTFPAPSSCTDPNLCVKFGTTIGGGEDPAETPVILYGGSSSYEEIDVLINMSSTNLMEQLTIISGDIDKSDVKVFLNQSGGYSIYAHARNIQNTGTLFTIRLEGPTFLSSGGTATLTMEESRYDSGTGNCCSPCLGQKNVVVFIGFDDCTADITLRASAHVDCGNSYVLVYLDWPGSPISREIYTLNFVLDFDFQDVQFNGTGNNYFGCPSGGFVTHCGNNDCITFLDDHTIQFCYATNSSAFQTVYKESGLKINLLADAGCINGITFREAYLSEVPGVGVACVPNISVSPSFPLCSPMISGITNENDVEVKDYDIVIDGINNDYSQTSVCSPIYAQCAVYGDDYTITPSKGGDDLNGVTTYDLVLMTRHVLGTQLLNSPYKIIAADINKSNTVTTFDIVELRKMILHINESFPNNTSWRFVPKSFVFQNPANPFASPFPEVIYLNNLIGSASGLDFIAIKIGDVNISAELDGDCFTSPDVDDRVLASLPLETTVPKSLKKGEVLTLPIKYEGDADLPAFQMGIGFDESSLSFIGAAKGDLERLYEDNFGLTETDKGHVRMLWFSPDEVRWLAKKRQTLFYLSFTAKQDIDDVGAALWLDDAILDNRGYDSQGNESRLVLGMLQQPPAPDENLSMSAKFYPNPFSGPPVIEVSSDKNGVATLWLFNAFGVRVAYREVELVEGTNTYKLDEAGGLPKGVYVWKVKTPGFKTSGIAVKQ